MLLSRARLVGTAVVVAAGLIATAIVSIALADDASDRDSYLRDIDSKLSSAASELSGVRSDSDDGDIRDADGYVEQVRDLVSRLDRVKGDHSRGPRSRPRWTGCGPAPARRSTSSPAM